MELEKGSLIVSSQARIVLMPKSWYYLYRKELLKTIYSGSNLIITIEMQGECVLNFGIKTTRGSLHELVKSTNSFQIKLKNIYDKNNLNLDTEILDISVTVESFDRINEIILFKFSIYDDKV